jgi:hypothetical protein
MTRHINGQGRLPEFKTDDNGYRMIRSPGHVLAHKTGRWTQYAPHHRYVCFESLGKPGKSKCHWCQWELPWLLAGKYDQRLVVQVDHLDNDRQNNVPANLVPACYWCNRNRAIYATTVLGAAMLAVLIEQFVSDMPPVDRPDVKAMASLSNTWSAIWALLGPNPDPGKVQATVQLQTKEGIDLWHRLMAGEVPA